MFASRPAAGSRTGCSALLRGFRMPVVYFDAGMRITSTLLLVSKKANLAAAGTAHFPPDHELLGAASGAAGAIRADCVVAAAAGAGAAVYR